MCCLHFFVMCLVQGMKKHKLLREDILPAMASNRKVQRLLNEFMDLVSEYESAEANIEKKSHTFPTEHAPAAGLVDSALTVTNQMNFLPAATDQMKSVNASTDQMDSTQLAANQENTAPLAKDQCDSDPPVINQVSLAPQDAGS